MTSRVPGARRLLAAACCFALLMCVVFTKGVCWSQAGGGAPTGGEGVPSVADLSNVRPANAQRQQANDNIDDAAAAPLARVEVAGNVRIVVTARDEQSKAVTPNLEVWFAGAEVSSRGVTNSKGVVEFSAVPGTYSINAVAPGVSGSKSVVVDGAFLNVELLVRNLGWRIRGMVLNHDGEPVPEAAVELVGLRKPVSCLLNERAEFDVEIGGEYNCIEVRAAARGYVAQAERVLRAHTVTCTVSLRAAATRAIRVIDTAGNPISGCAVLLEGQPADMYITRPDGTVVVDCIDPTREAVDAKFSCAGYEYRDARLRGASDGPTEVVMQRLSSATVIATDAAGRVVEGAEVRLVGPDNGVVWNTKTNAAGEATLMGRPGLYALVGRGRWVVQDGLQVSLGGAPYRVSAVVTENTLWKGRVVADGSGLPIGGAVVQAVGIGGRRIEATLSQVDGAFELYALESLVLTMCVSARGYDAKTVEISGVRDRILEVRMPRSMDAALSSLGGAVSREGSQRMLRVRLLRGADYCWPLGARGGEGVLVECGSGNWRIDGVELARGTALVLGLSAEGLAERCVLARTSEACAGVDLPRAVSVRCRLSEGIRGRVSSVRVCQPLIDGTTVVREECAVDRDGSCIVRRLAIGDRVHFQAIDGRGKIIADIESHVVADLQVVDLSMN